MLEPWKSEVGHKHDVNMATVSERKALVVAAPYQQKNQGPRLHRHLEEMNPLRDTVL